MPPTVDLERSRRVLLIDDNVDATDLLQLLLTQFGYTVEKANSGKEGLDLANRFVPHVIFLDLGMPGMSGYEVARQLRRTPLLQDVFLLALTGWEDQKTRREVIAAGFDRHLVKRASWKQLAGILEEYFASHDVTDATASVW